MPKNLEEKIAFLLAEIRSMRDQDARERIKQFFLQELAFLESEYIIEKSELSAIQTNASKNWIELDLRTIDRDYVRTWLLMDAFVSYFRNKGLIPFKISLKKEDE